MLIGQALDQLGVEADLEPEHLICSAVVVLSYLVEGEQHARLTIANSEAMTFVEQTGLLRIAEQIALRSATEEPDEEPDDLY